MSEEQKKAKINWKVFLMAIGVYYLAIASLIILLALFKSHMENIYRSFISFIIALYFYQTRKDQVNFNKKDIIGIGIYGLIIVGIIVLLNIL